MSYQDGFYTPFIAANDGIPSVDQMNNNETLKNLNELQGNWEREQILKVEEPARKEYNRLFKIVLQKTKAWKAVANNMDGGLIKLNYTINSPTFNASLAFLENEPFVMAANEELK